MTAHRGQETKPRPFELLLTQDRIAQRVTELGRMITEDYAGKTPVLVGVLKGCVVFIADLIRAIKLPLEMEFVVAASYGKGTTPDEHLTLRSDFSHSLRGRDILIVEGVVDSGRTVTALTKELRRQEPASIEVVTLIDKPGSHQRQLDLKYRGFSIGNEFVIGFGLDNTQRYRNLPFIGKMLEE